MALIRAPQVQIMVLEMVLWQTPGARAVFGTSAGFARASRVLVANQGWYGGFLAEGLCRGRWLETGGERRAVALFCRDCVRPTGDFCAAIAPCLVAWKFAIEWLADGPS